MKQRRLMILLLVMVVLAAGRFAFSPAAKEYAIAEPSARLALPSSPSAETRSTRGDEAKTLALSDEADVPGNAFAVRVVPAPAAAASPVIVAVASPPPPPVLPAAPVPPPVPLQVIGTYDDGGPPAVFVATPTGTLIARAGTVLLAEYRVTSITPQQVAITEVSTQRTLQLAVPGGAPR
jgi:hypothetical protein